MELAGFDSRTTVPIYDGDIAIIHPEADWQDKPDDSHIGRP